MIFNKEAHFFALQEPGPLSLEWINQIMSVESCEVPIGEIDTIDRHVFCGALCVKIYR